MGKYDMTSRDRFPPNFNYVCLKISNRPYPIENYTSVITFNNKSCKKKNALFIFIKQEHPCMSICNQNSNSLRNSKEQRLKYTHQFDLCIHTSICTAIWKLILSYTDFFHHIPTVFTWCYQRRAYLLT